MAAEVTEITEITIRSELDLGILTMNIYVFLITVTRVLQNALGFFYVSQEY